MGNELPGLILVMIVCFIGLAFGVPLATIYETGEHDFYLVNPTKSELISVASLVESSHIRSVSIDYPEEFINNSEIFCLVQYITNSRNLESSEARNLMNELKIPYFRTKKEALISIGYGVPVNLINQCKIGN